MTDVQEGQIVRCIQRLDEIISDIRSAAKIIGEPVTVHKMTVASSIIKRDIVFTGSLYIKWKVYSVWFTAPTRYFGILLQTAVGPRQPDFGSVFLEFERSFLVPAKSANTLHHCITWTKRHPKQLYRKSFSAKVAAVGIVRDVQRCLIATINSVCI